MSYKEYLALAIPFVISTVTQPLLGAVDTAVLGRLDDAAFMGGVAIGAVIFNTLYWLFGFLRLSTTGFAAQSLGTLKGHDSLYAFMRPAFIAAVISLSFILLQVPIKIGAESLFQADGDVWASAVIYYDILIWGAPFMLIGYVNLGWLMGRKLIKETLYLQVSMNIINIVLDIVLVLWFEMGVHGVAYATLFSQIYGFCIGMYLLTRHLSFATILQISSGFFEKEAFGKIAGVNTNLFIRTICLLIMTNMFIAKGSSFGKEVLAANAVLFQIQYIVAYLYDGFANATSVFAGKAMGQKSLLNYRLTLQISMVSTTVLSLGSMVIVMLFSDELLWMFTDIESVLRVAREYQDWLILFPLVVGHGLVMYGLFTGCTFTAPVRDTMMVSLAVFVLIYFTMIPSFGNHALWFAFILFSLSRTVVLYFYLPKLKEHVFGLHVKEESPV